MKTAADVRSARVLLEAFDGLAAVRKGVAEHEKNNTNCLQLCAFDGDDQGGSFHGEALIPLTLSDKILDFIEAELRAEMSKIGVRI